jgi:hypothetical protein
MAAVSQSTSIRREAKGRIEDRRAGKEACIMTKRAWIMLAIIVVIIIVVLVYRFA